MKRQCLKTVSALLSILMIISVFCAAPISAGAADTGILSLSVTPADVDDSESLRGINWFYTSVDKCYYIFSPQTYTKDSLRLWFDSTDTVTCGDSTLVSGEVTDVFASGEAVLNCAGNTYRVKVLDGGDVGSVQINTESGSLDLVHADKEYKDPGTIMVSGGDGTVMYDGALDYIKGRGNSTWKGNKKPYNIKLAKKADLFGMGKAKKWCLLANAGDATFMRNLLSYKFAKDMGVEVTSDVVPVNLYVNRNYMGAYVITEKVEIGDNRVNIRNLESDTEAVNDGKLSSYPLGGDQFTEEANTYQYAQIPNDPDDITGGYLLELEKIYRYPPEVSGFITSRKQAVVVKEPEYSSKAEVEYIRGYYQQYEDAVYSQTGYNSLGKYYTEYVDVESIARMYIAEEFGANFDGCSSSFFLYKDVDGKICAGPAWDFDLSFQQTHGINYLINNTTTLDDIDSLYIQHCYINYDNDSYKSFLAQLFSHNDFQQVVQNVWNNVVKQMYPSYFGSIAPTAEHIRSTMIMNAIRWNTYGSTNPQSIINGYNSRLSVITNYIPQRYEFLSNAYSDDTFFVKYDIGTYGKKLVWDTNIYSAGDQCTVKALPDADLEHCCSEWHFNPDYSDPALTEGDTFTVEGNTNLYAKWDSHIWVDSDLDDNVERCQVCGRYIQNGELLEGWHYDLYFVNGKIDNGYWKPDSHGKRYYFGPDYLYKTWRQIDGKWYYFGADGYAYTGTRFVKETNASVPEWYAFGEDGGIAEKTRLQNDGLYTYNGDIYYVVNGYTQFGVQQVGDDIYFFNSGGNNNRTGYADRSTVVNVTDANSNGILTKGKYFFGADGKLSKDTFIMNDLVYVNGKELAAYYGLVSVDGRFYYVNDYGKIVKNKDFYVLTTNDLCYSNGKPVVKGTYYFDADGKMDVKEGLVGDTYYEDNKTVPYKGLICVDGYFYYVDAYAKIVKNKDFQVLNTNDLCYSNGKPVIKGTYHFDAAGKMDVKEGLVGDTYYEDNKKVPYKGLIQHEGSFYYVDAYAKIVKNKDFYVLTTNDLCYSNGKPVVKGTYFFDADGKMDVKEGLVGDTYYEDNKKVPYKGLIQHEGSFYYVDAYAKIVKNKDFYVLTTNDLCYSNGKPVVKGTYYFDADGKMDVKEGLVGDTYYEDNKKVPYKGLIQVDGSFYYVDAYAKIVKGKDFYVITTNGLCYNNGKPIVKGTYYFDADGKMDVKEGLIGEVYYEDNKPCPYKGLIKVDGDFYYVDAYGKIVKDKNFSVLNTNGLTYDNGDPVVKGTYHFDENGKMVIN